MSSVGTGQLSPDLNEHKLHLLDVELRTTSGTGNPYFTLELMTAVHVYLNINFRSFKVHNSLPWLGLRL